MRGSRPHSETKTKTKIKQKPHHAPPRPATHTGTHPQTQAINSELLQTCLLTYRAWHPYSATCLCPCPYLDPALSSETSISTSSCPSAWVAVSRMPNGFEGQDHAFRCLVSREGMRRELRVAQFAGADLHKSLLSADALPQPAQHNYPLPQQSRKIPRGFHETSPNEKRFSEKLKPLPAIGSSARPGVHSSIYGRPWRDHPLRCPVREKTVRCPWFRSKHPKRNIIRDVTVIIVPNDRAAEEQEPRS